LKDASAFANAEASLNFSGEFIAFHLLAFSAIAAFNLAYSDPQLVGND
jgi:hypothetical protein